MITLLTLLSIAFAVDVSMYSNSKELNTLLNGPKQSWITAGESSFISGAKNTCNTDKEVLNTTSFYPNGKATTVGLDDMIWWIEKGSNGIGEVVVAFPNKKPLFRFIITGTNDQNLLIGKTVYGSDRAKERSLILEQCQPPASTPIKTQNLGRAQKIFINPDFDCYFEMESFDFCDVHYIRLFEKILQSEEPNFDKNKILSVFEENHEGKEQWTGKYRAVAIDINTGEYYTLPHSFNQASYEGKTVPLNYTYNINSNVFCFSGDIKAYRDSYDYDLTTPKFCFELQKDSFNLIRE
jgi:hypothetical protein